MTVNDYISRMLENNEENQQIIVIYDDNHNIYYFGKAAYAPLNCWFAFKNAHMVGNELRINDIREEESNNTEREGTKMKTIRVYTRTVNMHTPEGWVKFSVRGSDEADMLELGYVDYDENGHVRGIGTEDFSWERFRTLKTYYYQIKKDSGEKTAAGKTKWDLIKTAVIRIAKADYAKGAKLWKKQYRDNGMIVV